MLDQQKHIRKVSTDLSSLWLLQKNYGLVMEANQPIENNLWEMMAYCDSDYTGHNNGEKV